MISSSRALEDICKGESFIYFNLGRNRFFRGDFDSVQFLERFTKIWGRKAKKLRAKGFGARVPEGCKRIEIEGIQSNKLFSCFPKIG